MININTIKTIHFTGIKGVGMSGLAVIAKQRGFAVSGSDVEQEFTTDALLKKHSISYNTSFDTGNITRLLLKNRQDEILLIVTAAHDGRGNPEAAEAQKQGIRVLSYGEALGLFMQGKRGISVAGSHGKTTTTALIAHILTKAKKNPSYLIGTSSVPGLGDPAHWGEGEWFIAEADEYVADPVYDKTPKFLYQHPEIAVYTELEMDHPDVFNSVEDIENAFIKFASNISKEGKIIVFNSGRLYDLLPKLREIREVITYGPGDAMMSIVEKRYKDQLFSIKYNNKSYNNISLPLFGQHNVHNACAAILAAHCAGVSIEESIEHIKSFQGTKRRAEKIGEKNGILFYDDYAHHPTEIETTINGFIRYFKSGGKRIIVIFQPHTYSRTKALLHEFGKAFEQADIVAITDIFASAREKPDLSISADLLVREIQKHKMPGSIHYVKNIADFQTKIGQKLMPGDILITMGAGDIYTWQEDIIKGLAIRA